MIIRVSESYLIQPSQFNTIRCEADVAISHHDLGVTDERLQTLSAEEYIDLQRKVVGLAEAFLWARLKPKLELADRACEDDDNLAAFILREHSKPQLPATAATTEKANTNAHGTKSNPQRTTRSRARN